MLLNLPVVVRVWLNSVWILFEFESICFGKLYTYVVNSFCRDLQSRINLTTSCFLASFESVSSDVEYCPVLVFFGFDSRTSLSNKTSPSCFGDAMLNSTPHTLNI